MTNSKANKLTNLFSEIKDLRKSRKKEERKRMKTDLFYALSYIKYDYQCQFYHDSLSFDVFQCCVSLADSAFCLSF